MPPVNGCGRGTGRAIASLLLLSGPDSFLESACSLFCKLCPLSGAASPVAEDDNEFEFAAGADESGPTAAAAAKSGA